MSMSKGNGLDPRVSFLAVLVMGTAVFIVKDLLFLLLLLVGVIITALPLRDRLSRYGRGTRGLMAMLVIICLLQALLVPGRPLIDIHLLGVRFGLFTVQGLMAGARVIARVGVLVFTSIIFTASVGEREFMDALLSLKVPYPVVFSVNIVLRTLPRLMEDAASINDSFKMRGVGSGRGYLSKWKDLGRSVRPLFVSSMVSAHRLGVSLELRGYDGIRPWKGMTRKLGMNDLMMIALMTMVLAGAIVSAMTGEGPSALLQGIWAE